VSEVVGLETAFSLDLITPYYKMEQTMERLLAKMGAKKETLENEMNVMR
jgi:hypothetical protein